MTRLHVLDFYMDGYQAVSFCKVCSAEGDKLIEDCQGSFAQSTEHRKMAAYLNLAPDQPETWPLDILDKLIYIENKEGRKRLMEEIQKLTKYT